MQSLHQQQVHDESEAERLDALRATHLLHTAPEPEYDDITEMAAELCQVPVALITLVDDARQWFKSVRGLSCRETSRESSVCRCTILQDTPLVVPDLSLDERFQESALVTKEGGFRFYAGVPLRTKRGHRIGSLCVIDFIPRVLSDMQLRQLRFLARQVERLIELRENVASLGAALVEKAALMDALAVSESRFRAFIDNSPVLAYIKDGDGRMRYYNRSVANLFQVTPVEWLDKHDHEIWSQEIADAFRQADLQVLGGDTVVQVEERSPGPDGSIKVWKSYKFPFVDGFGGRCLAGVSVDITHERTLEQQLREAKDQLEQLVVTDSLTCLKNRRAFDLSLADAFHAARRAQHPLSLLMLDVDHFKQLNDVFGHTWGDRVLQTIGETLQRTVRRQDVACRYGGEEFAIVLPDTTTGDAHKLGQRICEAIHDLDFSICKVSISVGCASLTPEMSEAEALLVQADAALYEAKRRGRNRVVSSA